MVIVTGILSVLPSRLDAFVADLQPLAAATRYRDGNLSYHTAVLDARSGQLLVAERWQNEAALAAHLQADDTVAFTARWQTHIDGDIRLYEAENERPLATALSAETS